MSFSKVNEALSRVPSASAWRGPSEVVRPLPILSRQWVSGPRPYDCSFESGVEAWSFGPRFPTTGRVRDHPTSLNSVFVVVESVVPVWRQSLMGLHARKYKQPRGFRVAFTLSELI